MPNIDIHPDYETLSAAAAELIAARLEEKPDLLLCLATGSTPTRTYELLAKRPKSLFKEARILKLDEWGGIQMNNPATCETYLRKILIDPLNLSSRYTAFKSQPTNPEAECLRIALYVAEEGPIDLCVLGLGINGHLGFNEPAQTLRATAHVAKLSAESLQHSMIQSLSEKPTCGLTLGIREILDSIEILLLASGPTKVAPLGRMLKGRVDPQFPASFLQKHTNTHVLCDSAAVKEIS